MGHPNARTGDKLERREWAKAAELARINIRVNLLPLKQDIVTRVYNMLYATSPVGPGTRVDFREYEKQANAIADTYIRAVDTFLKDHPGARAKLGSRNAVADAVGLANEKNAPWCAD